jgi:hypothetical protein
MSHVTPGILVPRFLSDLATDATDKAALHARGAALLAPSSAAHNVIQAVDTARIALTLKRFIASTQPLLKFVDESGALLTQIGYDGNLTLPSTLTGLLKATAGVVAVDSNLTYNATVGALVLSDYNFRSRQSSNPAWLGSIRDGDISNNGFIGGFRTVTGKLMSATDSDIDNYTTFRIEVKAGDGVESGKGYATLQTNSGGALVNAVRLQSTGDAHFTRNVVIGDSALTKTFGANAVNVLMWGNGTAPTSNGTSPQFWVDEALKTLNVRWTDGTVKTFVQA